LEAINPDYPDAYLSTQEDWRGELDIGAPQFTVPVTVDPRNGKLDGLY
jgi:hypothetical protein